MISLRVSQARAGFFDRSLVLRATDQATQDTLSKFGAYVRQRARSSIRKRRKVSEPGKPPSSHVGTLKNLIFFSYDFGRRSVVIGPTQSGRGEAPRLLEEGGTATRQRGGKSVTARYRARPYMGPAFAAELPRAPKLWQDSVR